MSVQDGASDVEVVDLAQVFGKDVFHNITLDVTSDGGVRVGLHHHSWDDVQRVAGVFGIAALLDAVDSDFDTSSGNVGGAVYVYFAYREFCRGGVSLTWFTDVPTAKAVPSVAELF